MNHILPLRDFLHEQEVSEQPYRILILKRDVPDDPNKTGDALEKEAKKNDKNCPQDPPWETCLSKEREARRQCIRQCFTCFC